MRLGLARCVHTFLLTHWAHFTCQGDWFVLRASPASAAHTALPCFWVGAFPPVGWGRAVASGKTRYERLISKVFQNLEEESLVAVHTSTFFYVVVALVVAGLPICFGLWGE